jgi:hypothetical protein
MRDLTSRLEELAGAPGPVDPEEIQRRVRQRKRRRRTVRGLGLMTAIGTIGLVALLQLRAPGADTELDVGGRQEEPATSTTTPSTTLPADAMARPAIPDRELSGALLDGRRWRVTFDPSQPFSQYCVEIGELRIGCADFGEPPSTPLGATSGAGHYPAEEAAEILFALLEPGAATLTLNWDDGRSNSEGLHIDLGSGLWVAVVVPGDNPDGVTYLDDAGNALVTRRYE